LPAEAAYGGLTKLQVFAIRALRGTMALAVGMP
jgi:hypothetical protein